MKKTTKRIAIGIGIFFILIILLINFSPYVIIRYYGNGLHIVKRDTEYIKDEQRQLDEQVYTSLGFSKLSNLKEVSVYCDKQSDLKVLKKMPLLKKLTIYLENGDGKLLNNLPYLDNIEELSIVCFYDGEIRSDTPWLNNIPNVKSLNIFSHDLSDISGLEALVQLEKLYIDDISINSDVSLDLGVLKNCPNLSELVIYTSGYNTPDTNDIYLCETIEVLSLTTNCPEFDICNISNMASLKQLKLIYYGKEYKDYIEVEVGKDEADFFSNLDNFECIYFDVTYS